jgi:hypothetical protein
VPGQAVPRLAAAATRTAQDSYRVRLAGSKSNGAHSSSGTAVGVFDPARRTGRLVPTDGGAEVRYVGDMVYRQLPGGLPGAPGRTRAWLASRQEGPPEGVSELAELGGRALQDPSRRWPGCGPPAACASRAASPATAGPASATPSS